MREEIFKDIEGYEGLYQISNLGRVKSLNYRHTGKEKIIKVGKHKDGYLTVCLYKEGAKKYYTVHKLVGNAFLSNPHGFKEVNHIDEDKTNNCADNLEWCSRSYNCSYNGRAKKAGKKIAEKLGKPVIAISKESGLIMEYESIREAERLTGVYHQNIIACCKGKYKSAGNFYWYYADTE